MNIRKIIMTSGRWRARGALLLSCIAVLSMISAVAVAAGGAGSMSPVTIARGVVDSVSGGNPPVLIIDGLTYGFAPDAKVELGGSFGAPSLVQRNMKVEYTFTTQDDVHRTIVLLRQLPPETRVPEH